MNKVYCRTASAFLFIFTFSVLSFAQPASSESSRWSQHLQNVTITRDDWGIAHIVGKTDADAVFGMIYAQAEDDFNRVETNYITNMGRMAETAGESAEPSSICSGSSALFSSTAGLPRRWRG